MSKSKGIKKAMSTLRYRPKVMPDTASLVADLQAAMLANKVRTQKARMAKVLTAARKRKAVETPA